MSIVKIDWEKAGGFFRAVFPNGLVFWQFIVLIVVVGLFLLLGYQATHYAPLLKTLAANPVVSELGGILVGVGLTIVLLMVFVLPRLRDCEGMCVEMREGAERWQRVASKYRETGVLLLSDRYRQEGRANPLEDAQDYFDELRRVAWKTFKPREQEKPVEVDRREGITAL